MSPAVFLFTSLLCTNGPKDQVEMARYLRPAGKEFATECEFTLTRGKNITSVVSVTQRGKMKLEVSARYDAEDLLTEAKATSITADKKLAAGVRVAAGKATIQREGQPAQEFDVTRGIIVTSAPDWTDAFLMCRHYDRKKQGKQSFPGLWIHPEQPAQRLTFAMERQASVSIEHEGAMLTLERYTIWLRGKSAYAVWADAKGQMIKLVPLPYKDGATNWLVRDGYQKSTAALKP